mgnify:CR=1 FL=1
MTPALFFLVAAPLFSLPFLSSSSPSLGKDSFPGFHPGLRVHSANSDCECRAAKKKLPPSFYPFPFKPFSSRGGSTPLFPSGTAAGSCRSFPLFLRQGMQDFSLRPLFSRGLTFSQGRDMVSSNAEMPGQEENWNRHSTGKVRPLSQGKEAAAFPVRGYAPFLPPCSQELEKSHLRRNE